MAGEPFSQLGKWLLVTGVVLIGVGLMMLVGGKVSWIGRLPGDLLIRRDHMTFYFPLTTCLLASALLTVIVWLIGRFRP